MSGRMLSVALSRQAVDYCLRSAKDARQSVSGVNGGMCKKFALSGRMSKYWPWLDDSNSESGKRGKSHAAQ